MKVSFSLDPRASPDLTLRTICWGGDKNTVTVATCRQAAPEARTVGGHGECEGSGPEAGVAVSVGGPPPPVQAGCVLPGPKGAGFSPWEQFLPHRVTLLQDPQISVQ